MAEYQKIEYRIGKDGKITETVLEGVAGDECLELTREIEEALGEVSDRDRLPEGDRPSEWLVQTSEQSQSLHQQG